MKRFKQLAAALMILMLCLSLTPLTAYADDGPPYTVTDSSGSVIGGGYYIRSNGTVFFVGPYSTDSVSVNGQSLSEVFNIGQRFAFYTTSSSGYSVFDSVCPKKGSSVTLLYLTSNGLSQGSARVGEIARDYEDGTVLVSLSSVSSASSDGQEALPILAVAEDGNHVAGICYESNNGWVMYIDWYDAATFNSTGGGSSGGSSGGSATPAPTAAPSGSSGSGGVSLAPPTQTPASTTGAGSSGASSGGSGSSGASSSGSGDSGASSSGGSNGSLIGVAVGVLLAIGGVVFYLVKKKKTPAQPVSQVNNYGGYPGGGTEPFPGGGVYAPGGTEPFPGGGAYAPGGTEPFPGGGAPAGGTVWEPSQSAPAYDSAPKTLYLRCQGGYQDGREFPVQAVVKIGRTSDNSIKYPDEYPGVSREHATLILRDGKLYLTDTSSRGTWLKRGSLGETNAERVPAQTPIELNPGDSFYIAERNNKFTVIEK